MNPLLSAALGSILRWGLALGAGYLVKAGIWSGTDADTYVTAATLAGLSLGWSLWSKYHGRIKFLTALSMPQGATENTVNATIASGLTLPSASTPRDTVPYVSAPGA